MHELSSLHCRPHAYFSFNDLFSKVNSDNGHIRSNHPTNMVLELVVVSSKGVIGDEDAFIESRKHEYLTSCECVSLTADVYEVRQEDFLKEFKKQVCWNEILNTI